MKRFISLLVAGSLITFLLLMITALGIWSFTRPVRTEPMPQLSPPLTASQIEPPINLAELAATGQARHATYIEQQTTLQATIQERSATYQSQIAEVQRQLTLYQAAIEQYQQDTHTLDEQISQLEQALAEREANYQTQVEQAIQPFQDHSDQLLAQREAARQALSAAEAQLER